ncbi:MAG: hypothetical protein ACPGPF_00220, partial [Pontibacterium sp.]
MSKDSDSWKDKYRELANESEAAQKEAERLTHSLEKIITALSMALEGDDQALDSDLNEVKVQVEHADARKLDKARSHLEKRLRSRDKTREKHIRAALEQLLAWVALLRARIETDAQLEQLQVLEVQATHLVEQEYNLPEVLKGLLSLDKQFSPNLLGQAQSDEGEQLLATVTAELSALVNALSSLTDSSGEQARGLLQQLDECSSFATLPSILKSLVALVGLARSDNANLERFL